MLKAENLSVSYQTMDGTVPVLRDLSFEIHDNEIFGIAGESGCGKSTLIKALYDIVDPPMKVVGGRVLLQGTKNGKDFGFETGNMRQSWWKHISYVPQAAQSVLNPITRLKGQFLDSVPEAERRAEKPEETLKRCADYLKQLDLSPDLLDAYPFQLSGGMRQRVVIALATFLAPSVVLADEPTTALDVVVQRGILMMLVRLQREMRNTMVIVSHDMGVHYQITHRLGMMYAGTMVEIGPTAEIFEKPLHPYTRLLIGSLPRLGDKSRKTGIPGRPPAFNSALKGCRFAPRCPLATARCREEEPKMYELEPGRFAACHLVKDAMKRGKD